MYAGAVLTLLKQMCRWAVARGYIQHSPAEYLDPKSHGVKQPAPKRALSLAEVPLLMAALAATHYPAHEGKRKRGQTIKARPSPSEAVRRALRLVLLTACRPGEVLGAEWSEVDLAGATWTIPPAKQKLSLEAAAKARPFIVPLSPHALEDFKALRDAAPKGCRWVFPGEKEGEPLSEKVLSRAMRRMLTHKPPLLVLPGGRITAHDLRRTARTLLGESLKVPDYIAERCLNHSPGRIAAIYDKGDYLEERRDALVRLGDFVSPAAK